MVGASAQHVSSPYELWIWSNLYTEHAALQSRNPHSVGKLRRHHGENTDVTILVMASSIGW
jgi:hypothetical protein